MEHHVRGAKGPAELRDVVPPVEGIRISGPWSTTSGAPEARPFFFPLKKLHAGGNLGRGVRRFEPYAPAVADRMLDSRFDNPT